MSAILSTDDLNDFISPSVACIKPVETLPGPPPSNEYEVMIDETEPQGAGTAQISLTDCLACSGCVTSAEAVLVSLQSHAEVLNVLDLAPPLPLTQLDEGLTEDTPEDGKIFVASVSPQVRASLAATYHVTEQEAGAMVEQLLSGPDGLARGGLFGNKFAWVVDTNRLRDLALAMVVEEAEAASRSHMSAKGGRDVSAPPHLPVLSSACPGWICYVEKTHPHVLRNLSKVKSPQALAGTMLKTVLAKSLGVDPSQIYHLALMPCFDKKLEASRQELTDAAWRDQPVPRAPVRDVDCVITAREVVMLADSRNISFPSLSRRSLGVQDRARFPDPVLDEYLFQYRARKRWKKPAAGTSGGYLYEIMCAQRNLHPRSTIKINRGRNADVTEYTLLSGDQTIFKGARYYGFRNIQNLVRKLKPTRSGYALPNGRTGHARRSNGVSAKDLGYGYIEVMACPGGCTNGGGQVKVSDLSEMQSPVNADITQKEWLAKVDEAYFSADSEDELQTDDRRPETGDALSTNDFKFKEKSVIAYWSEITGVPVGKLIYTTYKEVESEVGKKQPESERVAALAGKIGGGW